MHKYLVATGLKIDRHVLPLFVPFCENGPYLMFTWGELLLLFKSVNTCFVKITATIILDKYFPRISIFQELTSIYGSSF